MNIKEYGNKILGTTVDNWLVKTCWGAGSGPSFLNQFNVWTDGNDRLINIDVKSHAHIATLKDDINIFVAWGLTHNDDFVEKWANEKFSDKKAISSYFDFFYNNSLVLREIGVAVDGGRCYIPLPEVKVNSKLNKVEGYFLSKEKHEFFRLINNMTSTYDYDSYFNRTGIQLIDEEWFK